MVKDVIGNVLKVGDTVIFGNMKCTIKEILENRIIGAQMVGSHKAQGLKIPDTVVLEMVADVPENQAFNGFKIYTPANNEGTGNA